MKEPILQERPDSIKPGDIWLEPISEILQRSSVDMEVEGYVSWDDLLADKREDSHYEGVVDSLRDSGFVRPLTCTIEYGGDDYKFGDGHHRLAAAIELGETHVPLEAYANEWYSISEDSAEWQYGDEIPLENRRPR